jgi:hypothetical protein
MELRQLVEAEIARLKSLDLSNLLSLPSVGEQPCASTDSRISIYVFCEESHDSRTLIVAAAYRQRFLWTDAYADGFAVAPDGEYLPLSEQERDTLY